MAAPAPLPPFQTVLDSHGDAVLAFLRGLVGPNDAEDCFQETFIAALRAYPELHHGRELRAWLLTIARRKALDNYRARARRARPLADPTMATEAPSAPVEEYNGASDGAALWRVVAGLPEGQRAAVALRYAGGLRYREMAEALGCSEDAARRRVHDGLRSLRRRAGEIAELVA